MEIKDRPYMFTIEPGKIPGLLIGAGVLVGENLSRLEDYNLTNWVNDFEYNSVEKDISGLEKFIGPALAMVEREGRYLDLLDRAYEQLENLD